MANYATSALKLSDTYVNTLPYNTCSTAASTAAKTVDAGSFSLETGAMVVVKFTVTNTADNPTLNVSSTGAKAIMYRGSAISAGYLAANRIYTFIYDGTDWELVGDLDTNTNTYQRLYPTTGNVEYPITTRYNTTTGSSYYNEYGRYSTGVTLNPSTNAITATTFKGALSGNATSATKLATARTINGMSFDGSAAVHNYGICSTAAGTAAKTVTVGSTFSLVEGAQVVVKFTNNNSASSPTLNVNSTGAKPIYRYGTTAASTSQASSGWRAGAVMHLVYDGTGWVRDFWENTTYYTTAVTCATAAETAAKVGSTSYYTLANSRYFILMIANANTYAGALTLNVNSAGAKPIYINGSASSSSNYTLPAGLYICYYNGTNYYVRTDSYVEMNIKGTASGLSSTLSVSKGGTGYTSITDTTYTTARYRASALISTTTAPTTNGVINWVYE